MFPFYRRELVENFFCDHGILIEYKSYGEQSLLVQPRSQL